MSRRSRKEGGSRDRAKWGLPIACRRRCAPAALGLMIFTLGWGRPSCLPAREASPFAAFITRRDALLVAGPGGGILHRFNVRRKQTPASTLKILTALAAIHNLGRDYRFQTDIHLDAGRNLKLKGYGDPLLVSEVWEEIADSLAGRLREVKDLVLDDHYFASDLAIPGIGESTNPYDAPVGALSANFNTVSFRREGMRDVVSAEPQTPMVPLAQEKIRSLRLRSGRHVVFRRPDEVARYAGELLAFFLKERGVRIVGKIRLGRVKADDERILRFRSPFTLEKGLRRLFEFSNNFIANQILLALGAHVHGPPATLAKGVRVVTDFCREELHLQDVEIAEGSGISRRNRMTALDMLAVLRRFAPHRDLLPRDGPLLYKRGTLRGVRTAAGYVDRGSTRSLYFVVFLNRPGADVGPVIERIKTLR